MYYHERTYMGYIGFWPFCFPNPEHVDLSYHFDDGAVVGLMPRQDFWLQADKSANDSALYVMDPEDKGLKKISDSLEIRFRLLPGHEFVRREVDYWFKERPRMVFKSIGDMIWYFFQCSQKKKWLSPEEGFSFKPEEKLLKYIFFPKDKKDRLAANRWSFMAHKGIFHDCVETDRDKALKFGVRDRRRLDMRNYKKLYVDGGLAHDHSTIPTRAQMRKA